MIRREALAATMGSIRRPSIEAQGMPVVHRFGPYRFYFYSNENRLTSEPPHVQVVSGGGSASFWLAPVSLRQA